MFAHTLGNPFDAAAVSAFARKHHLWLIEDCCDAAGSRFGGKRGHLWRPGNVQLLSRAPHHHGRGRLCRDQSTTPDHADRVISRLGPRLLVRPGKDNTCGKRFAWQLGPLPLGYDHKYTYSHIGYNLKITDMQAAVGVSQLEKLDLFIEARRRNFQYLAERLEPLSQIFLLPRATPDSEPSWFGYPIAVRPESGVTYDQVIRFLHGRNIGTRVLFGGNLLRQPAYRDIEKRVIGDLPNSDFVANQVFWIGVYPGLTGPMLDYIVESLTEAAGRCVGSSLAFAPLEQVKK